MAFTGKFDLVSSENFDAYLKAVGVGLLKRQVAATMKPTIEISEEGGVYTMKTISVLKNTVNKFTPGVEFDEELADGRTAKSTITVDGNKLVQTQKIGDETATTVREFSGDQMTAVFTCGDVVSTRVYKKTG